MRAAVLFGPHDLRVTDFSKPELKDDSVMIRVSYCGICGTDFHKYDGKSGSRPVKYPVPLGHEVSGIVEAVGADVSQFKVGDRVTVDPNWSCGKCWYCRNGKRHLCSNSRGVVKGMAEFVCPPEENVYLVPESLSLEAAALTEPLSCCLHGVDLLDVRLGETVAIVGFGAIGQLIFQLLKHSAAGKIIVIETVEEKRALALEMGAFLFINPTFESPNEVLRHSGIECVEKVVECAGLSVTAETALDIAGRGATVVLFGVADPDAVINLKQYDVQEDILLTMEQRLYAHIDFADKYPELYGIVKRRQGICQNRKCNYAEAIRCYTSAMFLFTGKNYDRSKVKNNEAVVYRRWMRIDMACQTFDEAYRLRKERESFAPETIDPLRSNQVIPLSLAGQFKEAEEIIEPVLRHRREEYENDPARKFKYLMTLLNSLQLIVVQGYRTEEPKRQTDLKIQFDKRVDETEQVLQNITPDAGSFQYHVNLDLLRSGQFLLEKRYDMALLKAKSALKLFDELGTLDSLSEKKSLCVAYLYECKAYCAKNQNPEALESALAAFRLANELRDCRDDKSYFRYFYMVAAYHLAAILTMTDSQENTVDITGENLLSIAITEMQLLMEPTQPYVLNKYDDYNRLAYHVEYAKMCKFRENLPALLNGDLSAEELKFLVRECLLTYYVHTERED